MAWFTRNSRVGNDMGDLFDPNGQSPTYESDNFARDSFQAPQISASDYRSNQPAQDDYFSRMRALSAEPSPSMDAYRAALAAAPQAEDYRPSWATRIAAGLGGISEGMKDPAKGISTAMAMNRAPYTNALADYKAHIDPLEAAAKIESEDSDSRMKYYQQAAQLDNTRFANNTTRQRDVETANWHNRTAGDTEKYQGWQMASGDKRLNAEISNYGSLADYRKNQNIIGRTNANTQRQGMLNTNTNASNRNAIDLYGKMNPPKHYVTPPTASGIDTAAQSVMSEMSTLHPDLVVEDKHNPGSYVPAPAPPVGTPAYFSWKAGMDDMQKRIQRRASGQMDFGVGGGGGDNPYEDLGAGGEEP